MKVLFLDIDGVVNSAATYSMGGLYPLDKYMAFLVGKIQLDTGCDVVLSSSWRHHPRGVEEVEKHVVKVIDKTPEMDFRGQEIKAWLDKHPEVTRYAILDDDRDFYPDQHLFRTNFETGLTDDIAAAVIKHLNSELYDQILAALKPVFDQFPKLNRTSRRKRQIVEEVIKAVREYE